MSTPPQSTSTPQLNCTPPFHKPTGASTPLIFLTLPVDIRLLIYDLFTLTTTHYTITAKTPHGRPPHSLSVVVHRLPGISLLRVCRTIYAEALSLRRKIDTANALGQQLLVQWNGFGGTGMKSLIKCVAKDTQNREMDMILGAKLPDEEEEDGQYDCWKLAPGTILRRDFSTYEDIQRLLRRGDKVRRITIAMDCVDQKLWLGRRNSWMWEFYTWFRAMGNMGEGEMEVVLVWFQFDGAARREGQVGCSPLMDDEFPEEVWEGRKWRCTLGERIESREFEKWWAEGEKW
jgi:hypothetical protein